MLYCPPVTIAGASAWNTSAARTWVRSLALPASRRPFPLAGPWRMARRSRRVAVAGPFGGLVDGLRDGQPLNAKIITRRITFVESCGESSSSLLPGPSRSPWQNKQDRGRNGPKMIGMVKRECAPSRDRTTTRPSQAATGCSDGRLSQTLSGTLRRGRMGPSRRRPGRLRTARGDHGAGAGPDGRRDPRATATAAWLHFKDRQCGPRACFWFLPSCVRACVRACVCVCVCVRVCVCVFVRSFPR